MAKKTPGVAFYGKVRIPTIGHRAAIDQAKALSKSVGGKLTIGLSGTAEPLDLKTKKAHAEKVFNHPVETGAEHTKTLASFLTHLHKHHDHLHLVAGSDRVDEYHKFLKKYNGKPDKSGKVPFNFKSYQVHAAGGERKESNKDPRKMSRAELTSSVSASKLEGLAKEGKWDHFKAYHPDMPEAHVRRVYTQIRKHHSLKESINEEVTRKELAPMLDSFVSFASKKLGIESMPAVRYKSDEDEYNSFAAYNPSKNELSIQTKNRHPMDVFRSIAHELVHHKQNEDGRIGKDIAREGETGSDIENEANAEAGKIMRWFAKDNPKMFASSHIIEDHAANHASSGEIRGMGYVTGEVSPTVVSHYVTQNIADTKKMQASNSTHALDTGEGEWKDEETRQEYLKKNLQEGINDPGKMKAIFLAGGPGSGKDFVMNSVLQGEGLREINSDNAFEYLLKKHGLDREMPASERVERDILRGRAKNLTKERERLSLVGRLGLIVNGTADDIEKIKSVKRGLEDLGYETMMVFVNTSNEVSRQRNVERGKSGGRKVQDGTDKQGVPDSSPDIRQEKWESAQRNIGELQKVFGNENFAVIDNSVDVRKATPEQVIKVNADFARVRSMAQKFVRAENTNPKSREWIDTESQKRGIEYQEPKRYKTLTQVRQGDTPMPTHKPDNEIMAQARRLGLSYYGFGRFGRKVSGKNTVLYHSKGNQLVRAIMKEENINEISAGKAEKAYQKTMDKMNWHDHVAGVLRRGGFKDSEKREVETSMKLRKKAVKFADYVDKKTFGEEKKTAPKGPCWKGYEMVGMKKKNGRSVPNCVPMEEGHEEVKMSKMKKGNNFIKKKVKRKLAENVNTAFDAFLAEKNGNKATEREEGTNSLVKVYKQMTPGEEEARDGVGPEISVNTNVGGIPVTRSIYEWVNNTITQEKFQEKYGDLWEHKLVEAAIRLEESGCGYENKKLPKSIKELKESEAWQRKEGKSEAGGLNRKGIASYRRANPGSKLSMAVTTKPSKLKKGSKSAKRRKSFCARMGGMKKRLTSAKTARDPDSRINKALRKWNCEE